MTEEQLQKANELKEEKKNIELELRRWNGSIMDYLKSGVRTNISEKTLQSIVLLVANELKLRIVEIDKEFKEI